MQTRLAAPGDLTMSFNLLASLATGDHDVDMDLMTVKISTLDTRQDLRPIGTVRTELVEVRVFSRCP